MPQSDVPISQKSTVGVDRPSTVGLAAIGTGTAIGPYELQEELHRERGVVAVFRARHATTGREVAVKLVGGHAEHPLRSRTTAGGRAAMAVKHPNIAQVFEVLEEPAFVAIAMDLVGGRPLSELRPERTRGHPVPSGWGAAARLVLEVSEAVAAAHRAGVVHRDLKPSNILIEEGTGRPRLIDFGIAKQTGRNDGATRMEVGTPAWMSPEQHLDPAAAGPEADVYALGLLLYWLVVGDLPWAGKTLTAAYSSKMAGLDLTRPEDGLVPDDFWELVERWTGPAEGRPRDGAEAARRIRKLVEDWSVTPTPSIVRRGWSLGLGQEAGIVAIAPLDEDPPRAIALIRGAARLSRLGPLDAIAVPRGVFESSEGHLCIQPGSPDRVRPPEVLTLGRPGSPEQLERIGELVRGLGPSLEAIAAAGLIVDTRRRPQLARSFGSASGEPPRVLLDCLLFAPEEQASERLDPQLLISRLVRSLLGEATNADGELVAPEGELPCWLGSDRLAAALAPAGAEGRGDAESYPTALADALAHEATRRRAEANKLAQLEAELETLKSLREADRAELAALKRAVDRLERSKSNKPPPAPAATPRARSAPSPSANPFLRPPSSSSSSRRGKPAVARPTSGGLFGEVFWFLVAVAAMAMLVGTALNA